MASGLLFLLVMFGEWTETKRKRRIASEEDLNRDGHWSRDFSVRGDSWTIIEHWASENHYRLVALKGRRRTYQKGDDPSTYQTVVEIRHEEGRIVLAAFIRVGMKLRMLTLFLLPGELPIEPKGFRGIRTRRTACQELNSLLMRLRQPEIAASDSFHILDLDMTTLVLGGLLIAPLIALPISLAFKLELHPGLSNALLSMMGNKVGTLSLGAAFALALHHWVIVKRINIAGAKLVSLISFAILFWVVTIFSITRTRTEMVEHRVVYHCVLHYSAEQCSGRMAGLSDKEREQLSRQIEAFHKHLSQRDK